MIEFKLIGMRAETHIHVGEGQSRGAVDLPVARELSNGVPLIPGSSVKGALRADFDADARNTGDADREAFVRNVFGGPVDRETGQDSSAGAAMFFDAFLVALPVRSNRQPCRLVTAPILLDRLLLALERAGEELLLARPIGADLGLIGGDDNRKAALTRELEENLLLEDLAFSVTRDSTDKIDEIASIFSMLTGEPVTTLAEQLVVVGDEVMRWLMAYALPVRARNRLDEKKTVVDGMLWYEETLPPDTIMATMWGARAGLSGPGAADTINAVWAEEPFCHDAQDAHRYLQIGGNETVGQGWFRLTKVTP